MSKKIAPNSTTLSQKNKGIPKTVVSGAATGGILGALAGYSYKIGALDIPGLTPVIGSRSVAEILTGTLLGIFIVGGIGALIGLLIHQGHSRVWENDQNDIKQDAKLQILEEQLAISKKWMQTGEVAIHKEVLKEEKNIIVPITREELVIEKKVFAAAPNNNCGNTETIRIPIKEERIEIIKHPVILNDVSVSKHKIQGSQRIEATLKKNRVHLEIIGQPDIVVKENRVHKNP